MNSMKKLKLADMVWDKINTCMCGELYNIVSVNATFRVRSVIYTNLKNPITITVDPVNQDVNWSIRTCIKDENTY
jgi:hypothetical protein